MATSRTGSSLAARLAAEYEQQTGRPASADDPQYAAWVPGAMQQMQAADAAALARSKGRWNNVSKAATIAAGGVLSMGALSALGVAGGAAAGGAGSAGGAGVAAPAGWAGVSGTTSGGAAAGGMWSGGAGAAATKLAATEGARRGIGRVFTGDNLTSMAGLVSGLYTNGKAATASERANALALAESRRASEELLAFNREEAEKRRKADAEVEAEKKRQFDMTEAEKRRQWEAKQPWRDASLASLARLGQISGSAPAATPYQPTFQYRP